MLEHQWKPAVWGEAFFFFFLLTWASFNGIRDVGAEGVLISGKHCGAHALQMRMCFLFTSGMNFGLQEVMRCGQDEDNKNTAHRCLKHADWKGEQEIYQMIRKDTAMNDGV